MIKMVNEFKLTVVHFARPNPMQICACTWIYRWTEKPWKMRSGLPGLRTAGPPGRRGPWAAGPSGRRAAGPWRAVGRGPLGRGPAFSKTLLRVVLIVEWELRTLLVVTWQREK